MDIFDTCAQIRMDAGKGKKCPGGYSIPRNHKCGGKKKLSSPETSSEPENDTKRKQRKVVNAGLITGLGLTGVALAGGVGLLAAKASSGKGERPLSQDRTPSPESVPRKRFEVSERREQFVEFLLNNRRSNYSGAEPFDEIQHRKLAEIESYEEDEDLMDIEMFRLGEEGSLATIAKNIKNLESRGVGNALRQTMEGYASIHESEARRFASEPMIGTLMENIRRRQIQDEWDAVARYQSILGLFSRKDSLFFDEYYTLCL